MISNIVFILAVNEFVQDSINLLMSKDEANVYHATKRLLKQASFLSGYSAFAVTLLQPTLQYSALKITT